MSDILKIIIGIGLTIVVIYLIIPSKEKDVEKIEDMIEDDGIEKRKHPRRRKKDKLITMEKERVDDLLTQYEQGILSIDQLLIKIVIKDLVYSQEEAM